ncbi:spirocyclase AveC family protein [Mycolicibacterium sp. HK-90]|uniref:spirocyclase AveC family protein n=1 Tax=Mycolicibacterium sp. HK-90 TaxID=3056937 RepID=UPI00265B17E2|nr:spirocyclase AveC family protein [Mycolicibacterium sp. HK-90]WKG05695.1 spirocyclase AveC family protein [Mycolicibacterium sp. HK-90]
MEPPIRVDEPTGADDGTRPSVKTRWKVWIGWTVAVALAIFVLASAEKHGPVSPENANPAGVGKPPPVEPLLYPFDWVFWGQMLGALLAVGILIASVVAWRRQPGHPVVLMVIATSTLLWWDPINNWAIGLVYNPKMWHFPRDWPWFNISPVIEPLTSFIYSPYVLLPYFLAMPILRALQRRSDPKGFVWRHPLVSIAVLTFVIGVVWDAAQEILLTRAQFLTYTHVIEFGSIDVGKYSQFPLLMASVLITIIMIPASVLLYRDDTGKTQADKIAQRLRLHRRHPKLATFLVMTLVLNVAMISFSSTFWLVRATGAASTVACPWPYPQAKTWDPRGYYETQGAPGPFTAGEASTWQIGQPDGRPTDITVESDRCTPR